MNAIKKTALFGLICIASTGIAYGAASPLSTKDNIELITYAIQKAIIHTKALMSTQKPYNREILNVDSFYNKKIEAIEERIRRSKEGKGAEYIPLLQAEIDKLRKYDKPEVKRILDTSEETLKKLLEVGDYQQHTTEALEFVRERFEPFATSELTSLLKALDIKQIRLPRKKQETASYTIYSYDKPVTKDLARGMVVIKKLISTLLQVDWKEFEKAIEASKNIESITEALDTSPKTLEKIKNLTHVVTKTSKTPDLGNAMKTWNSFIQGLTEFTNILKPTSTEPTDDIQTKINQLIKTTSQQAKETLEKVRMNKADPHVSQFATKLEKHITIRFKSFLQKAFEAKNNSDQKEQLKLFAEAQELQESMSPFMHGVPELLEKKKRLEEEK